MTGKSRGRPRTYDPDRALQRSLEAFWLGGFAGTSLDSLAAATSMNRPSLYAAFGDKKALYLKALTRFSDELREKLGASLSVRMPIAEALAALYQTAIDLYQSGVDGPRGCFIVCTAPVEAALDEDIRAALHLILSEMDEGLEARFEEAAALGELPPQAEPAGLARLAAATLHSLAIRARAGEPRRALDAMADHAVRLLCGAKRPRRRANAIRH